MRRKTTDAQEKEIRRRFFHLNHDWRVIAADYGISEPTMRRIVGGPLHYKDRAIERVWN